jgi:hypothetical protein
VATSAAVLLALPGCQSTQSKSAELAKQQKGLIKQEKGLEITKKSTKVRVGLTAVLQDKNGAAAVVELRNSSGRALAGVPVAIDVRGGRRSIFRNDDPGLEPSLIGVPVLRGRERMLWVNDQLLTDEKPTGVRVEVGREGDAAPSRLPRIELTEPQLELDPTSGWAAIGKAVNHSQVLQKNLVIHGVARKGGRVVAAGRSLIERLKPGKRATYQVFFIGDPRGAQLTLAAPPTRLE